MYKYTQAPATSEYLNIENSVIKKMNRQGNIQEERIDLLDILTRQDGWNIPRFRLVRLEEIGEQRMCGKNEVLRDILQALKNGYNIDYIVDAFLREPLGHPHFIYMSSDKETRENIFSNALTQNNTAEITKFVIKNHYLTKAQVTEILKGKEMDTRFLEQHPNDLEGSSIYAEEEESSFCAGETTEQDSPYVTEPLGKDSEAFA